MAWSGPLAVMPRAFRPAAYAMPVRSARSSMAAARASALAVSAPMALAHVMAARMAPALRRMTLTMTRSPALLAR